MTDDYNEIIPVEEPSLFETSAYQADEKRGCSSGCLWGIGGAFGCLLIPLIAIAAALLMGITTVGGLLDAVGSALGTRVIQPSASVTTTQTIITGIQPLGQLVSISSQLAQADIRVNVAQGALNACGFAANHVAQGAVEAGFDLTQIGEDDLVYDALRDIYVLTVPPPQLTSCRVDYIRQYERSFTTCAVDWDEARLLANYYAMQGFRDTALEGGILGRAESEARLVLANFVQALTGKRVEIIFEQADGEPLIPQSCQPQPPGGWVFNETNGAWQKVQ